VADEVLMQDMPVGLYVHLPWCVRKCPYCDFNSHVAPAEIPERRYVDALIDDLDLDLCFTGPRTLGSIFFGGGTPSLFSADAIARVITAARARLPAAADIEITLEANPGTIEHGRFAEYRAAGINRVSLGAQTFSDTHLKALGRIHTAGDVGRAVDELVRGGIENFNLDLMYALPGQDLRTARADVEQAIALEPTHMSYYELTLEPGTVFYHRPPVLPSMDQAWDIQQLGQELLTQGGYEQYEISAYSREQGLHRCSHNLNYWRFGDYIGIGAGAHGKYSSNGRVHRTTRQKQPREYLRCERELRVERQQVEASDLSFEFFLNTLRLHEGFSAAQFRKSVGLDVRIVGAQIAHAENKGWLTTLDDKQWRVTEAGRCFLNDLQALFLPSQKLAVSSSNENTAPVLPLMSSFH
jgi:putative oxygen-independent coproporphyrinogen III oxidase